MTRRELIECVKATAEPVYGEREAGAIARLFAERRQGASPADLMDLAASRPIQYILGVADFADLELAVGEGVLIPRPETEELVGWIVNDSFGMIGPTIDLSSKVRLCNAVEEIAKEHTDAYVTERIYETKAAEACFSLQILDVGTGSGAIAISLAKNLPGAGITAIDISPEALKYARLNNAATGAGITILQKDALDPELDLGARFDIIVSNPPYIPAAERATIADNVAKYEPATALFVPDDDPLVFYRAIARLARRSLTPGGALYFEIHENAARAVKELLKAEGFSEVDVKEDINSKPRMVRCRL